MEKQEELKKYIYNQIQSGLNPDEIESQLVDGGWSQESVKMAFEGVQSQITPTSKLSPSDSPVATFAANGKKRGRIKTAWLLFKQSIKVLKNNKQLVRYPFMGGLMSLVLAIFFGVVFLLGQSVLLVSTVDSLGQSQTNPTLAGYLVGFAYYVLAAFIIFTYNAGLTAHVLDIFKGKSEEYGHYMKIAWSKKGPIFVFSLISTTVGFILHAIEERSRILGWLVSRILGTLWALANLFTIPIIVSSDLSAPKAIKKSTQLFISRWGENIGARIAFGGVVLLFYLLVAIPVFIILGILLFNLGVVGIVLFIVLLILSIILLAVIESAASNILSTALFYYADTQKIPAAFEPELLNSVFIPKKNKKSTV